MTPEAVLDGELENELRARIQTWEKERDSLLKAADRVAELNALINHAQSLKSPISARVEARKPKEESKAVPALEVKVA